MFTRDCKKEDMIECLTVCFNNAFGTDAQARNALDYAAYVFGDEEVVAHLQKKNVDYYKCFLDEFADPCPVTHQNILPAGEMALMKAWQYFYADNMLK